ncbi:MAG TPA: hypothetical protein VF953_03550 [Terriglobales bacterium]
MAGRLDTNKQFRPLALLGLLALWQIAAAQDPSTTLLQLQRSRASLDISSNAKHAQGMNGITYGNPGDVWSYPNSLSCLVVYGTGRYVLEKREERTVGKPKVKSVEGTLTADDLQQLKAILDDEALKGIKTPKMPDLPPDTAALREIESLDLQIDRAGNAQHFTTMKRRVKTGASDNNPATATASTGLDIYQDNEGPFKKTLNPLMKWFEGLEKKSKSDLKESKPQYCRPINIG